MGGKSLLATNRPTSRNVARALVLLIAITCLEYDGQEFGAYPGALIDPMIDEGNTLMQQGCDGQPPVIPTPASCHAHCCATKGLLLAICPTYLPSQTLLGLCRTYIDYDW
eukprot:5994108-Ditylum_brightwellii.AAC.1